MDFTQQLGSRCQMCWKDLRVYHWSTFFLQIHVTQWCSFFQSVLHCLPLSSVDGNCAFHSVVPPGNVSPGGKVGKCVTSLNGTQNTIDCLHTDTAWPHCIYCLWYSRLDQQKLQLSIKASTYRLQFYYSCWQQSREQSIHPHLCVILSVCTHNKT